MRLGRQAHDRLPRRGEALLRGRTAVDVTLDQVPTDAELAAACDRFHERVASPTVQLTAADVNAFDGVPSSAASRRSDDGALAAVRPERP